MIVTVTANVAIDRTYRIDQIEPGEVHKIRTVSAKVGGKGVNVSRVLKDLGLKSRVVGLSGAFGAREATTALTADGFECAIYPVAGPARQSVTVTEQDGRTTTFDEPGPTVTEQEWRGFEAHLGDIVRDAGCVIVAGSLPPGAATDGLSKLLQTADRGALTVADARGSQLLGALRTRPGLAKLNRTELTETTGRPCDTESGVVDGVEELHRLGAARVLVTLGSEGAVGFDGHALWRVRHPPRFGNPIGAGDAFTAGVVRMLVTGAPFVEALAVGAATALASLSCPTAGHADPAGADAALVDVVVEPMIPGEH